MKNSVVEALYLTLSIVAFTLALAYSVGSIISISKEFNYGPGTEGSVYILDTKIPEQVTLSGAELIGSLYKLNFSEQEVEVNGIVIESNRDLERKQNLILRNANYIEEIDYDTQGNIKKLNYTMYGL